MKNEDNTRKEQRKEHRGCVTDHSTIRERGTIRHTKSESYRTKYLETGSKGGVWNVVQRFREFRNRSELRRMRGGVRTGAKEWESIAEFGFEYFCPDYVSKNGVSVMERNNLDAPKMPPGVNVLLARFLNIGFACRLWLLQWLLLGILCKHTNLSLRNNEKI